jgi:RHS repeat-associated protein
MNIPKHHKGFKQKHISQSSPFGNLSAHRPMQMPGKTVWSLSIEQEEVLNKMAKCTQNISYSFGMQMPGRSFSSGSYRYGFNGKESDDEVKGSGNSLDYEARIYDPRLGRWLSIDPLASKFPFMAPYSFAVDNPILIIDEKGNEPARNQAGTIQQAIAQWNSNKKTTSWDIMRYIQNNKDAIRYVYTEDNGWIDLQHYFGAINYGETAMDALEVVAGPKFMQDLFFGEGADKSYFSYEDLPSNAFGGDAPVKEIVMEYSPIEKGVVPKSKLKKGQALYDAIEEHFGSANATSSENAPNWTKIPFSDQERKRIPEIKSMKMVYSLLEKTEIPIIEYYSDSEKSELLKSGDYVPQNHSEQPMNLDNFPAAKSSLEKK